MLSASLQTLHSSSCMYSVSVLNRLNDIFSNAKFPIDFYLVSLHVRYEVKLGSYLMKWRLTNNPTVVHQCQMDFNRQLFSHDGTLKSCF